jgi:hypothetical protein
MNRLRRGSISAEPEASFRVLTESYGVKCPEEESDEDSDQIHKALSGRGLKTYNHNRDACYRSEVTFSAAGGGRHSSARRAPPRRSGAIRRRLPHRTRAVLTDLERSAPEAALIIGVRWFGGDEPVTECLSGCRVEPIAISISPASPKLPESWVSRLERREPSGYLDRASNKFGIH